MTNSVPNSGRDSTRPPGPATDRYRGDVVAVQRGTPHQTEPNRDGSRQPEYPEISSNPSGTSSFRNLTLSAVAAASSGKMRPSASGPTVPATLSSGLAAARVPVSALCLDRACRTPSITQPQGFETPQWPGGCGSSSSAAESVSTAARQEAIGIPHGVVREQRRGPVTDGTCAVSDGWGCSAGTRALGGGLSTHQCAGGPWRLEDRRNCSQVSPCAGRLPSGRGPNADRPSRSWRRAPHAASPLPRG